MKSPVGTIAGKELTNEPVDVTVYSGEGSRVEYSVLESMLWLKLLDESMALPYSQWLLASGLQVALSLAAGLKLSVLGAGELNEGV